MKTPIFQYLTGRNPEKPSPGFPSIPAENLNPGVAEPAYGALRLGTDTAVKTLCRNLYADPLSREALKRTEAVGYPSPRADDPEVVSSVGGHLLEIEGHWPYPTAGALKWAGSWRLTADSGWESLSLESNNGITCKFKGTPVSSSGNHTMRVDARPKGAPFVFFLQGSITEPVDILFQAGTPYPLWKEIVEDVISFPKVSSVLNLPSQVDEVSAVRQANEILLQVIENGRG